MRAVPMTIALFKIDAVQFRNKYYPAFSRRATQVCILSSALEKIALGAPNAQTIAHAALKQADAFGWNSRATDGVPVAPARCAHTTGRLAGNAAHGPNWCPKCGALEGPNGWVLPTDAGVSVRDGGEKTGEPPMVPPAAQQEKME
jgi:hypothetical protein